MQQKPLGLKTHAFRKHLFQKKNVEILKSSCSVRLYSSSLKYWHQRDVEMVVRKIKVNKVENGIL